MVVLLEAGGGCVYTGGRVDGARPVASGDTICLFRKHPCLCFSFFYPLLVGSMVRCDFTYVTFKKKKSYALSSVSCTLYSSGLQIDMED